MAFHQINIHLKHDEIVFPHKKNRCLANMVNGLPGMSRIQGEGLNLNLRPVDLHALSRMVVKLSLPLAGGSRRK